MSASLALDDVAQLLQTTLLADAAQRQAAEAQIVQLQSQQPEDFCTALARLLTDDARGQQVRTMSAILLKRTLGGFEPSEAFRRQLQTDLLEVVLKEPVQALLQSAARALAVLAAQRPSPELAPTLLGVLASKDVEEARRGHMLLAALLDSVQEPIMPHMRTVLAECQRAAGLGIGTALESFAGLLTAIVNNEDGEAETTSTDVSTFVRAVPNLLKALPNAFSADNESHLSDLFEALTAAAEEHASSFRPVLSELVQLVEPSLCDESLDALPRATIIEFFMALLEAGKGMCRKNPVFIKAMTRIAFKLLAHSELSLDEWEESEESELANDSSAGLGASMLDRMSLSLGPKAFGTVYFQNVQAVSASPAWQSRAAVLFSFASVAEGFGENFPLPDALNAIASGLSDSNPRVRYAALHGLGQVSTDMASVLHERFGPQVLALLTQHLERETSNKVRAHSCAAIVNFCEECPSELLQQSAEPLLGRLHNLIMTAPRNVQAEAITAVAAIMDQMDQAVSKFSGAFVPLLLQVLNVPSDSEFAKLRQRAIECLTLFGMHMERSEYDPIAQAVMKVVLTMDASSENYQDIDYLSTAAARVINSLRADFKAYLAPFLKVALPIAQLHAVIRDLGSDDESDLGDSHTVIRAGPRRIAINTEQLEARNAVVRALTLAFRYCMDAFTAEDIAAAFAVITHLTDAPLSHDLFEMSNEAVMRMAVGLARGITRKSETALTFVAANQPFDTLLQTLLSNLQQATEPDQKQHVFFCLQRSLVAIAPVASHVSATSTIIKSIVRDGMVELNEAKRSIESCASGACGKRGAGTGGNDGDDDDDDDEEEEEGCCSSEEELFSFVCDTLGSTIRLDAAVAMPEIDAHATTFAQMLTPSNHDSLILGALMLFADVLTYGGPAARKYIAPLKQFLFGYCMNPNPQLRQAAVFAVGSAVAQFTEDLADSVAPLFDALTRIITAADARHEDNEAATDNAVSTLVKVLALFGGKVDAARGFALVANYVPFKGDVSEQVTMLKFLCGELNRGNTGAIGPRREMAAPMLRMAADALRLEGKKALSEEDAALVKAAVAELGRLCGADFAAVLRVISAQDKATLAL